MVRHRFEIEDSRHADCAPAVLLEKIRAPATWPAWQSEILSIQGPRIVETGDVVRGEAKLLGFRVEGHSTSLEATEESYLEDVIVGVRMRIRYSVVADGDGSRVTHRLESDLPQGMAGRVLAILLRRRLRKMQSALLDELVVESCTG